MKRKRLPKIKTLRAKLWEATKTIIRARYMLSDKLKPTWACYTCYKLITDPKKCHTGHLCPRASGGLLLYYSLDALRPQCDTCNRHRGGEGAVFLFKLMQEIGPEKVVTLLGIRGHDQKPTRAFFQSLLDERTETLKNLGL